MTLQGDAAKTETAAAPHAWLHEAAGEQLLLDVAVLPDRAAHHAHYRGVCW